MEGKDIEAVIIQAVMECVNKEGWVNLAELGTHLRKSGIRYDKLSAFLSQYEDLLELKTDTTVVPPAVYARLKREDIA